MNSAQIIRANHHTHTGNVLSGTTELQFFCINKIKIETFTPSKLLSQITHLLTLVHKTLTRPQWNQNRNTRTDFAHRQKKISPYHCRQHHVQQHDDPIQSFQFNAITTFSPPKKKLSTLYDSISPSSCSKLLRTPEIARKVFLVTCTKPNQPFGNT